MTERHSDLIGAIYDCVLDPDGWPEAMRRICLEINCALSAILLLDLAPHIRRAVMIGDLLDLKSFELHALARSLDHIAAGVIILADNQRILHANASAQAMFASNSPLRARGGYLSATNGPADGELATAIAAARSNEAEIGASGIGVSLSGPGQNPVIAHVLPLAGGVLRSRLMQQATAAIFITSGTKPLALDLAALGSSFDLTSAEIRLLQAAG